MSIWKGEESHHDKPWGHEKRFSSPFGMGGKKIFIQTGHRNSLKYYRMKNQLLYCLSGTVKVLAPEENEFGEPCCDKNGNYFYLESGDFILIQSGNPYRLEAISSCELIEVTAGPSFSTRQGLVMLEDDYGRLENCKIETRETE